ncbi:phage tail tape measure protein [Bacillus thuringiensis]|uniref:Phage tail tape measure protein n=1 Tax=Bacillus thuringiensis serovar andalousiensis TaxID=257985 RepID=A0A6H0TD54_BACTU|nr:phage tail tape measure protein [Bacillus thuringiensis]QIW18315.1 phage tail tape measure protein [Bacillus thuringiensis serovar andalousiensis]
MANAGEVRAKLVLDNAQFRQGVSQARQDMQGLGQGAQSSSQGMSLLNKASAAAGVAVVAAVGASVKAAANFEQSMAKVKAISGATDTEFAQLTATAKNLGATTQFSASQAADGLAFLSLAGFKAQDSIDAMPAVLNLAAAGAIDLGTAADIASNIMTGFGLEAKDTGKAADILAKTFTTANTDMNQLGMAMKYVAPVANALGWDMTDAATAVAKMSDAGIQGSQAGTSLRAMLLSLANPTGQTAKAFDKLGISVVNSNGQFKPLPELISHISSKMEGMTDAQKTVTAAQLVGTEASAGFLALIKQGAPALQEYKTSLEQSGGTAERIAKIQQETLIGAWTQVKSAAEGLAITLGDALLPAFTSLAQGATSLVSAISSVDPTLLSFGVTAVTTTASIAGLALGISKILSSLSALGAFMLANPIIAGIAAATVGVGLLTAAVVTSKKETEQYKEVSLDTYKKLGEQANSLSDLANKHDEMRSKIKLSNEELLRYKDLQNEIKKAEEGETKQQMIAEYDALGKKAGVTKDEMNKYLQVNDEIIEKAPATATAFDSKGNAIVKTADEARKLANEYRNMQREELILQQSQLMKNQAKDLENYTKSLEKAREVKKDLPKLEKDYNAAQQESERLQKAYNSVLEESGGKITKKVELAGQQLEKQNEITNKVREEYREAQSATQEFNAQTLALNGKSMQYDKITAAIIEEQMAAAGVKGEISNAVGLINEKLNAELKNVEALEQQKNSANGLTKEQQQALDASNKMVNTLQEAKGNIQQAENQSKMFKDGVKMVQDQAQDMNEELGKPIDKDFNADLSKANQDTENLNKKMEDPKTKKLDADTKAADKSIDNTNKRATESQTKPVKADTKAADSAISATNAKATESKTKPVDANTSLATSHIDKLDMMAKNSQTKPIDANTTGALGLVQELDRLAKEGKTKKVDADVSNANAAISGMEEKAQRPLWKKIFVDWIGGNEPSGKRHNGGTLNTMRPKFHNGGTPNAQRNQAYAAMVRRPKFDEVDARLLKNEMVLTQAQQSHLFNFIRTANRPTTAAAFSQPNQSQPSNNKKVTNHFHIAEMNVRDDHDIERIAAELKQMERSKDRARGR